MKKHLILLILICFSIFFLCFFNNVPNNDLKEIKTRGVLLVGTTGDYYPMSFFDKNTKSYVGFDIELSEDLAKSLDVQIKYVPTTWTTLMEDTINKKFDIAISGITITNDRKRQANMSIGYLSNGKTILCRKEDVSKYINIESLNNFKVRVIENPGGLNEKFVRDNLPNANLVIHDINYEIPELIASGKADVMITETIEATYYSHINKKLAAPLASKPFTNGEIGMLLPKENKKLLIYVNRFINQEIKKRRIEELKDKYISITE